MGIGNKNYINRKSEGVKLGHIVAKDLRKLAASIANDTFRHESVPLEINLCGKKLTDEGLAAMVDGLRDALITVQPGHEVRLIELNLSKNNLTARSLKTLAEIVSISASNIRHIDLSHNLISVHSSHEEKDWEQFLQSFRRCRAMRRLTLSSNNFTKATTFETLARVYSQNPPVEGISNLPSSRPTFDDFHQVSLQVVRTKSSFLDSTLPESTTKGQIPNLPSGLRSIPHIIIQDVGMNSLCSLWLSYLLENHQYAEKFFDTPPRSGMEAGVFTGYGQKGQCNGIVYKPNPAISAIGDKLLLAAEAARRNIDDSPDQEFGSSGDSETSSSKDCGNSRSSHHPSSSPRHVNASSDLESMRRKLQRETIENDAEKIQLWSAALKLVYYSRIILSKPRSKDQFAQETFIDSSALAPLTNGTMTDDTGELESKLRHVNIAGEISHSPQRAKDWRAAKAWGYNKNVAVEARSRGTRDSVLNRNGEHSRNISSIHIHEHQQVSEYSRDNTMELAVQMAADPNSVLDKEQIRRAIDYGTNYQTLAEEIDHRAKSNAFQIWCVLERIGCLQYRM